MNTNEVKAIAMELLTENDQSAILNLIQRMVLKATAPADQSGEYHTANAGVVTTEKAVIYGKGGYTDPNDPRTPAMQKHEFDTNGKPIRVHGAVMVQPGTRYKCVLLDLIPHDESCQVYVDVQAKDGSLGSKTNARLLTGWRESATDYDRLYDAPASPGSFAMGREAKFYAPALGPCGAVMVDEDGRIDSDIAGSLGISQGQHMSFRVVFRER